MRLRDGVRFHDGTALDAEAVRFNVRRWNRIDHPFGHRDAGKTYVGWRVLFGGPHEEGGLLERVDVEGRLTLRFVFREPVAFLPAMLAAPYLQIHSPTAIRAAGPDYGSPAVGSVGTGPFRFEAWREGERVELVRYEGYWGAPAGVERVVVRGVPDATARLADVVAGTADIALNLAPDSAKVIRAHADVRAVVPDAELNVAFLAMNQDLPPFDDARVRRAVAHAIDREAIVNAFYGGFGTVSRDYLPPPLWGHADIDAYAYDPERARELLAEAGHADGFETELWYVPIESPLDPAPRAMAEAMASYLAEVGIDATPSTKGFAAYLADATEGRLPLYGLGWGANVADPDNILRTFFGAARYASPGWDDADVVDWLERARRTQDRSEREALYARVLHRVREDVPSVPIVHAIGLSAVRDDVRGFLPGPVPGVLPLNGVRWDR